MPRMLDLHPEKKLRNPARHIRSLEKWSRSLSGFFPTEETTFRGCWWEKIPIFEKAVSPPHTTIDIQRKCAQLMIDAAERIRDARPKGQENLKVYAFLTYPDMFDSFVEVDFGREIFRFFDNLELTERVDDDDSWREHFQIGNDSIRNLDLRIPDGFQVLAAGVRQFDSSWRPEPVEYEEWAIGELRKE